MTNGKYCRLRHAITKDEVQLAEDCVDGVHMIRHFYASARNGLFHEITQQPCWNEETFELIWNDTIKAYQGKDWEVIQ